MSELPSSWAQTIIGQVAELRSGFGFPVALQGQANGDIGFFKVGDISKSWQKKSKNLSSAEHYISREQATQLRATPFPAGSVVFAKIGAAVALNRRAILKRDSLVDNNVMGLTAHGCTTPEFLFQFMCQVDLGAKTRGGNVPSLRKGDVEEITFPLPPLAEQKRIVAKIEEFFSELDAGEASLRQARRQLGVYRQSLLKQAFEGKLTQTWRTQNPHLLSSPDQLLIRIQEERQARYEQLLGQWEAAVAKWGSDGKEGKRPAKPKPPSQIESIDAKRLAGLAELPSGWIWQTVENLVEQGRACSYGVLKPGPHVESGVPLIRVGDIQNGRVSTSNMKRVAPEIVRQYRRTELRGGEFLISLVGAIGRTAVVQPELRGANTARAVGVVPLSVAINAHFVEICFRSPAKLAEMVSQANEVARKTLNLEDVRKATVPLCSLPEQQEIIRLLDAQFEVIEQNEREIDAALKRSEALRQSILKKAFSGQLVPQDPTDEPASELLERIRRERAAESPKHNPRRRRPRRAVGSS